MADKMEAGREAFEAWAKKQGTPEEGWWFRQLDDGGYSAREPDITWAAWQAAEARGMERAARTETAADQALGLYAVQADEIRELLDKHAPETQGNLTARIAAILDAKEPQPAAAKCWCEACKPQGNPLKGESMRFIVCQICGNKRCPHATDHRNPCTNSNATGQKGSSWEHIK